MLNRLAAIASIVLRTFAGDVEPVRVEVFGPGVLSAGEVFQGTFMPDGGPFYVCQRTGLDEDYRIHSSIGRVSMAATTDVRYVANSGMLVTVSGRRFLIDAPIREGIPPYATSSTAEQTVLQAARAPYDEVDAVLITHWHEDHFSPEAVAAHLSSSPRTILISSPEVVDRLRRVAPGLSASRMRAVLPAPGSWEQVDVGGVPVHVLRIRHNPSRRLPDQHVAFLIGGAAPVLHVGDADPTADNFALLKTLPPVDLAFLPFWYVADASTRSFVADSIRPRRIVAIHVPPRDAEKIRAALRAANVEAAIAAVPGSPVVLKRLRR